MVRSSERGFSAVPSLLALVLGVAAGVIAHDSGSELLLSVKGYLEPLGYLWLRALQMIVFPLVISTLIVAISNASNSASAGRVGSMALVTFVLFLCGGGLFSVLVGGSLLELVPRGTGATILSASESPRDMVPQVQALTLGGWLNSLIADNLFAALAEGQLLPVILFTVVFGLALNRVEGEGKRIVQQFFEAVFAAMMTLVEWLLRVAPAAIFILCFAFASTMGMELTSVLASYLAIICGLLVVATVLLYPIAALLGGVSPRRFAMGVLPAQMVAVSTRSSLAALPALLEGARDQLRLKPAVAFLVLPLSVSVFKTHRTLSDVFSFLFLAHLFSIDLSVFQIFSFFVTTLILSFSAVGIPLGGGSMRSLPAYLAVGIPIEGVLLLKTVESIPDIFKTVLNVTGDMTVATILSRRT